jgi:1,2-phenylacetyl-CoA epoxidase catalytic subunit
MSVERTLLPKKYHDAVVRWRETYLPDYDLLIESWDKFFPKDPRFELCAYREVGICANIECGEMQGQPKFTQSCDMAANQAGHMLGAIRAQASTEFGSIQQHQLTLARAQSEQDQFWILRMMAEELRHGYQMLHLLVEDDWSSVTDDSSADMVEQILSMRTGSHILGAFNIAFDSFIDNVVFCALIDRVGKYQLAMQKVSSYKPMGESMPQMLREEAFHLAAGVVPLRRWAAEAGEGSVYITMQDIQLALNKWVPRGLEMFGDERGGGTNVRFGLKPMKNAEAQNQYYAEVAKVVRDLNMRFLRSRLPGKGLDEAEQILERVLQDGGKVEGIGPEDLLRMPDQQFYRRRGLPAFEMIGTAGERFTDVDDYVRHLTENLPPAYRAGRDFLIYLEALREVARGEITATEASRRMPNLSRVGGVCPCSKAVRWVVDEPANGNGNGNGATAS